MDWIYILITVGVAVTILQAQSVGIDMLLGCNQLFARVHEGFYACINRSIKLIMDTYRKYPTGL